MEDLPEPLGRDQPDAGALRLEQCVRRDGRPVHHVLEVGGRNAAHLADARYAVQHTLCRVGGCRGRLHAVQVAALVVHEQQVRERSPNVDSEPVGHSLLL